MRYKKFINGIYKCIDGVVSRSRIRDVIIIIGTALGDKLVNDKMISVKNFGTFYVHRYNGRNVSTSFCSNECDRDYLEPFMGVRFVPDEGMKFLTKKKIDNLR